LSADSGGTRLAGGSRTEARRRGWMQALRVYAQARVASMLFLGFSAGLPFYLVFSTLSAWLRQAGIQRSTIGMLSWVGILYSIKFLWAPLVDRMPLPVLHRLLGRRRSWMLLAQLGIVAGLATLADSNPAAGVTSMALAALGVAFCAATQDIALDAWRIESAEVSQQGAMVAAYQIGYRVALISGSAGALGIAGRSNWHASYSTMAALGGVGIITTLLIREPHPAVAAVGAQREARVIDWLERSAHWPQWARHAGEWFIAAVICPLTDFFQRYGRLAIVTLCFIGAYRLTEFTMGSMANPFYIDHGYTLQQIATVVKVYGLLMAMLGVLMAGAFVAKFGLTRSLVLGSALLMASNLAFAMLATTREPSVLGLGLVNGLDNLAIAAQGVALIAFLSSLTSERYTATQYALFSSLYALPGKILEGTSGFVVDHVGYTVFFTYTAALSLPGLVLLYFLNRRGAVGGARA
jgi:MFS transporter, PAT family, beta-lactamase induction signal transducer AmpG